MRLSKYFAIAMASTFCLSLIISQLPGQERDSGQKWNRKLDNPLKKKQYVNPIQMTDRKPQRKLFENRFKMPEYMKAKPAENSSSPLSFEQESAAGNKWFQGWGQRNRQFWRTTGDNMSQFAQTSTQRIRERTRNTFQTFSGNKSSTDKKPLPWSNGKMFNRGKIQNELPKKSTDWRASEQPKIKF